MGFNLFGLLPGDAGITQTVALIKQAVNYGVHDPSIRNRAEQLVGSCLERDERAEIECIFNWTKNHFRYLRDPRGLEYVKSPEVSEAEIIKKGFFMEDCDGIVAYLAALLKSIGYPVRAVVISIPGKGPDFKHIYLEVYLSKENTWLALEGTGRGKPMGWSARNERRRSYDL